MDLEASEVVITSKWGPKSWLVAHSPELPYLNDRPPHIEAAHNKHMKIGMRLRLGKLYRYGPAICWEVIGVSNGDKPAHFTVAYSREVSLSLRSFEYPGYQL